MLLNSFCQPTDTTGTCRSTPSYTHLLKYSHHHFMPFLQTNNYHQSILLSDLHQYADFRFFDFKTANTFALVVRAISSTRSFLPFSFFSVSIDFSHPPLFIFTLISTTCLQTYHRSPRSHKLAPHSFPVPTDPSLLLLYAHIHFSHNRDRHLIPSTYHSHFASRYHTIPATRMPIIATSRFSRRTFLPLCRNRFRPRGHFYGFPSFRYQSTPFNLLLPFSLLSRQLVSNLPSTSSLTQAPSPFLSRPARSFLQPSIHSYPFQP